MTSAHEKKSAAASLSAQDIYDVIRKEGEEELERPMTALFWSGIAAGLMISLSVLGKALFASYLPHADWVHLVTSIGYTFGFVAVVMGRMQLFTENTITTVLPFLCQPSRHIAQRTVKLWTVVLAANVIGAFVATIFYQFSGVINPDILSEMHKISEKATDPAAGTLFLLAIPSGVLIAAMVWMLPEAKSASLWIIVLITWIIAAAGFAHIIAGSVEMALLIISGKMGGIQAIFGFFLPVFAGNVIGGTAIFTGLAYGQVIEHSDH